jgi:hypothetical protein
MAKQVYTNEGLYDAVDEGEIPVQHYGELFDELGVAGVKPTNPKLQKNAILKHLENLIMTGHGNEVAAWQGHKQTMEDIGEQLMGQISKMPQINMDALADMVTDRMIARRGQLGLVHPDALPVITEEVINQLSERTVQRFAQPVKNEGQAPQAPPIHVKARRNAAQAGNVQPKVADHNPTAHQAQTVQKETHDAKPAAGHNPTNPVEQTSEKKPAGFIRGMINGINPFGSKN